MTGSKPTFAYWKLGLKKLTALVYVTDELLEDAIALESWLLQESSLEINFKVEDSIITHCAGQPLGILKRISVSVPKEAGQAQIRLFLKTQ